MGCGGMHLLPVVLATRKKYNFFYLNQDPRLEKVFDLSLNMNSISLIGYSVVQTKFTFHALIMASISLLCPSLQAGVKAFA